MRCDCTKSDQGRERTSMAHQQFDHLFKLVIIGDSAVGKSCLLLRFADDTYTGSYISTIGVDFRFKTVEVASKRVKLEIWDTAGQDKFHSITASFYRKADGVIFVFDVTRRTTFEHVRAWIAEVERYAKPGVGKLLVGNKSDMPGRTVADDEARALAAEFRMTFMTTSARTADGVDAAFRCLAEDLVERQSVSDADPVITLQPVAATARSDCRC